MARPLPLLLLGALAGASAALLVRQVFIQSPDAGRAAESTTLAEMSRRLDALASDLHAMRGLAERGSEPPAIDPVRALPPVADARFDAIVEHLQRLEAGMASLAERFDRITQGVQEALTASARNRSEPVPESLPATPPVLARFDALRGREMDELTEQHLLWTYEKVAAEYGRPTRVAPSANGVGIKYYYYYYEIPDGSVFVFWFVDGKVIGAFW
jgi:hypothetical protein